MSKVLTKMNNAVQNGGKELEGFARVAGVSGQEFANTWKKDPYQAVQQFEEGLSKQNKQGKNVKEMLKDLGITEIRETDTVLRLANGNKQLQIARENANKGYKEGNALSKEAETKYKTLGNQMKIFMNHVRDLGISLGEVLAPMLIAVMKALTPMIDALAHAPKPIKAFVVALALIPVAAVPVLGTLAAITGAMGLVGQSMLTAEKAAKSSAKGMGLYRNAMLMLTNPIQGTKKALTSLPGLFARTGKGTLGLLKPTKLLGGVMSALKLGVKGLGGALRFLTGPVGIALTAITLLWKGFKYAYDNVKWFREGLNGLGSVIKLFSGNIAGIAVKAVKGIGNAFKDAGGWIKDKFIKEYKASQKAIEEDNGATKKFQDRFKQVFKTLGTASKKATDTTKVLGKGISKGTKDALGSYINYSEKSSKIMASIKNSHNKITDEQANDLINKNQSMHNELIKQFEERKNKEIEIAQKSLKEGLLTQEQYNKVEQATNDHYQRQLEKSQEYTNDMLAILNRRKDGELSNEDVEEYERLLKKQNELGVRELSKGEKEQEKILRRMSSNRKAMSVESASEIIKESNKSLKASKKAAQDRLDQRLLEIEEMKGLSKTEKDNLIKIAQDKYETEIKDAKDKHKEIKDDVVKNNKDIENEMDLSNGKVYSNSEKWWNQTTDNLTDSWNKAKKKLSKNAIHFKDMVGKGWDNTKTFFSNAFHGTGEWFSNKGRGFARNFKQGWDDGVRAIGDFWSWIKNTGAGIGTWFANKGHEWYNNFITRWNETKNTMGDLWAGIKEKGSSMGSWFSQKGRNWYSGFKNKWEETRIASGDLWAGIKNTGSNIGSWFAQKGASFWTSVKTNWNKAMLTTGGLWNSLVTFLSNSFGAVKGFFSGLGSKMWTVLKTGWSLIVNSQAGQLFTSLIAKLGTAWGSIKSWFYTKGAQMLTAIVSGWKSLSATATATFSVLWQNAKKIWAKIWGTIRYYSSQVASWVYGKWQSIKNFTVTFFTGAWTIAKNIWKGITNTIKYWTGLIWNRIKSVFTWVRNKVKSSFMSAWNTTKKIWKGVKETIQYWTQAIWNRIKAVFGWIKKHIKNAFDSVWSTTKRIWKNISNTIKYWTNAIWKRIKSIYNTIKKYIKDTLDSIWSTTKRIWKGIKTTISYWVQSVYNKIKSIYRNIRNYIKNTLDKIWSITKRIWKGMRDTVAHWLTSMYNKVRSGWNNIKNKTSQMAQAAWNAVKDKFKGMYNSAKHWVDKIGSYISSAKKWMKNKAISLGKSVANGAIWGLNKMIGGVNKISKAITSKNLMKKIPELSTGTVKGKPKSNRKGQLRQPTPAIVNDKGKGNGKGSKGHQEVIQRKDGSMYAPQGKNVLVNLQKGDIVHSGRDTQTMQDNGIIPRFASGTKKKKNLLQAAGDAFSGFTDKAKSIGHKASDAIGSTTKKTKELASSVTDTVVEKTKAGVSKGKEIAGKVKDSIDGILENVEDWMEKPKSLVNTIMDKLGISFGEGNNTTIKMAKLAYDKLKSALVTKVKDWFEESFGGGGGYNPYTKAPFHMTRGWTPNGHAGIDYGAPTGTPIPSPIDGKVIQSWFSPNQPSGGNETQIWDGQKYTHIFMHQSKRNVKIGDKVHQGEIIGKVGNTGNSFGSHLHWQVNKGKGYLNNHPDSVNPLTWAKQAAKAGGKSGGVNKAASAWAGDIRRAAKQMHVSVSSGDVSRIVSLIQHESGGNAGVTQGNIGDINNIQGNPAKGLLQYIPQTFANYAVKGHKNIWSGYDQLLAFFNNKYWRSQFNPMGGWSPNGPRRYAHGGLIKKHGLYEAGEGNRAEMVLPLTNKTRTMQLIDQAKRIAGIKDPEIDKEVNINSTVSTTDLSVLEQLLTRVITNQEVTLTLLTKLLESSKVIENKETGILESTLERLHNKHQDKRERKESRISKYNRGGFK